MLKKVASQLCRFNANKKPKTVESSIVEISEFPIITIFIRDKESSGAIKRDCSVA